VARRRLIWQLYPSYLLITLLSLLAVTTYGSRSLRRFFIDNTINDLEARAILIRPEIKRLLLLEDEREDVDSAVKRLGTEADTRITVIMPDGRVIGDSQHDTADMDNHRTRPEVIDVLEGGMGSSSRYSVTLQLKMMYVAVPILHEDRIIGVLRTSTPLTVIDSTLNMIYRRIAFGGLIITLFAAWISWINSRRITKPLVQLRKHAERIAAGDFTGRVNMGGTEEMVSLADGMNQMANQLEERIQTILRQRKEQKAVFSSISEGVLAVDENGLLISINKAAARLFGVERKLVRGRTLKEVITNEYIRQFVGRALSTRGELEDEIIFENEGEEERFLQVHGRPLVDELSKSMGAVIVLNDVTRIRKLEQARSDFVANVSHELRTPITSIKGFVETLRDGALDDPQDARRFVDIIDRQANRLDAIIEDLLSLARIEREAETSEIELNLEPLAEVISGAITAVTPQAQAKNITIETHCDAELKAWINSPIFEQAIINLVDNAIKYSGENTLVRVSGSVEGEDVLVSVEDHGIGIAPEHLDRLFERFYRVDKGRSRAVGGTGLGLAIVKHIVLAHGGNITVESTQDEGSIFTIFLPQVSHSQQLSLLRSH